MESAKFILQLMGPLATKIVVYCVFGKPSLKVTKTVFLLFILFILMHRCLYHANWVHVFANEANYL